MLQNERSEEQQQPHNTTYNSLNVYGDFNYCPNGPQKDAARDFSARKDRDNTDSLGNHIFDTKIFDSDDKLNALLGEIARSIDLGEYNVIYGSMSMAELILQPRTNGIISLRPYRRQAYVVNLWATKSLWRR